jgi:hypothetical protein
LHTPLDFSPTNTIPEFGLDRAVSTGPDPRNAGHCGTKSTAGLVSGSKKKGEFCQRKAGEMVVLGRSLRGVQAAEDDGDGGGDAGSPSIMMQYWKEKHPAWYMFLQEAVSDSSIQSG